MASQKSHCLCPGACTAARHGVGTFCARNAAKQSTYRLHRGHKRNGNTLRKGTEQFFVLFYNGCNTVGIMQSAPQMGIRTPETSVLAGTPVCIMWRSTMQPSEKNRLFLGRDIPSKENQ